AKVDHLVQFRETSFPALLASRSCTTQRRPRTSSAQRTRARGPSELKSTQSTSASSGTSRGRLPPPSGAGAQAVVILSSPLMSRHGRQLADLANARRLPTISLFRENVVEGCLMGYGPSLRDAYRRNGQLAGRILRGARPAEIPIERPTRFEFVVNLKTAK